MDKVLWVAKNSSTSEVWLLPKRLFLLLPISMGEHLRPCRKKIAASASKNGEYVLTVESNVVQKYYVGSCRQLKRMSRSWSMCLPVLSLSVFIAPVCNVKVDDI